jgi:hypothetical protein
MMICRTILLPAKQLVFQNTFFTTYEVCSTSGSAVSLEQNMTTSVAWSVRRLLPVKEEDKKTYKKKKKKKKKKHKEEQA